MPAILPALGAIAKGALKVGIPAAIGYGAAKILGAKPEENVPAAIPAPQTQQIQSPKALLKELMGEIASIIKDVNMSPKDMKFFINTAMALMSPLQKEVMSPYSTAKTIAQTGMAQAKALEAQRKAMLLGGNEEVATQLFGVPPIEYE